MVYKNYYQLFEQLVNRVKSMVQWSSIKLDTCNNNQLLTVIILITFVNTDVIIQM